MTNEYTKQLDEAVMAYLKEGLGPQYRVTEYSDQLVTEESIRELASNVAVMPNILVDSVPVDVDPTESDTTSPQDMANIEILVAVSNNRSLVEQKREAVRNCFYVRKILTGKPIATDITNTGTITGGSISREFNVKGLAIYVVTFSINFAVDLEAIKLPTEV